MILYDQEEPGWIAKLILQRPGTIFLFGNGGSAAQADHFAGELMGRFRASDTRPPIRAHCLSNETGALTATANDFSYAVWPSRYLMEVLTDDDLCIWLSTSGRSDNVLNGIRQTVNGKLRHVLITGQVGDPKSPLSPLYDWKDDIYSIVVDSLDVCEIQEQTLRFIHAVCVQIEGVWKAGHPEPRRS